MELTIKIGRLPSGQWKAAFPELPGAFFLDVTEDSVRTKAERLSHALRSPNSKIAQILPNGDVVLSIGRSGKRLPDNHLMLSYYFGQAEMAKA